jgi:hypothetical protein
LFPYKDWDYKEKLVLIVLGIVVVLLAGMNVLEHYYYLNNPKVGVTCECSSNNNVTFTAPNPNMIVHNNIQASHSYNDFISTLNGLTCMRVDDMGSLWGNSMMPTFFEGNTVFTVDMKNDSIIRTGDMVRYFRFSELYPNCTAISNAMAGANSSLGGAWVHSDLAVIHRISAIYGNRIVVQGDNLNQPEVIDRCQITNIVVGVIYT